MMTEENLRDTSQSRQLSSEPVNMGTAEVVGIFPIPVYIQKNAVEDQDVENLRNIDLLPEHVFTANYGLQSSNSYILNLPENDQLKEKIKYYINDFANNALGLAGEYEITQSWVSIKKPYQMHHPHVHPNSIISGVLYFDNIDDAESIIFHKNIDATDYVMRPALDHKKDTIYKHSEVIMQVSNYMLVLFPSYLDHAVTKNLSKDVRISISGNLL